MGFSDISLEWIGAGIGTVTCFMACYNASIYEKTIHRLSEDPFRHDVYEQMMKDNRMNSSKDFFEYYAGMPGRRLAYRHMDNPENWKSE